MSRISFVVPWVSTCAVALGLLVAALPGVARASAPVCISGQDADGHAVEVNGKGHYTLVMYTNADLEDASRKMTLALDPYRARPDFALVRVVDLRGDVPPDARVFVRMQIREEMAKENARLKKAGLSSKVQSPIIPDFSGSTLSALGWDSVYDEVHLVLYDPQGHEVKRLESVTDVKQMTKVVDSVL